MKKRGKTISKTSINTRKKVNIPIVLFVLVLVFIVYAGVMSLVDKAITSPDNQVTDSGNLASYSSQTNLVFVGVIIVIFIIVVIVFLNIKVKKKRRRK